MTPTPDPWITGFLALLSGGGAKFLYDAVRQWRNAPPRQLRSQLVVDANIATVARARDELEEDNVRLRSIIVEERAQRIEVERLHAEERSRWLSDQQRLRGDVSRLEIQIRSERDEAAARYDALLRTVHQLQVRAAVPRELPSQEGA